MSGPATLVPVPTIEAVAPAARRDPSARPWSPEPERPGSPERPGLPRRAALAAVIAESRGAIEAALRTRRSGPRTVALGLWRAQDRDALQPRFVQLGTGAADGSVRWGRAILLRPESRNPLYLAAKDRLLAATEGPDPAAVVLDELARVIAARVPCRVLDRCR